jgi:hypothetical protein
MAEALVRYLDANGHPVYASTDDPLPVNIGSATLSVTADGVEIKNDNSCHADPGLRRQRQPDLRHQELSHGI